MLFKLILKPCKSGNIAHHYKGLYSASPKCILNLLKNFSSSKFTCIQDSKTNVCLKSSSECSHLFSKRKLNHVASATSKVKDGTVENGHKQDGSDAIKNGFSGSVLHLKERGIIFMVSSNESTKTDGDEKFDKDTFSNQTINEATLLEETRKKASNIKQEDIEVFEGYNKSTVNPLVGQIPVNPLQWTAQQIDVKNLPKYYASLAKSRLTGLVVLTSMAGYLIAPGPFHLMDFLFCSLGTTLVSSSANAVNQFLEVPFDSQMDRTKNRVLVRGVLTPMHTVMFGVTCGITGLSTLYFGVNGLAASLGLLNLLLYTSVYTPMKRISILNTWLGSVVGAIPPLMGWAACTGTLDAGSMILGGILFAWQFPHFNALSWNLRQDYSRAGYSMMSVLNPNLCRLTSLRYSCAILALSTLAPVCDVTTWTFAVDSLPLNLYFIYLAWKFHREGDSKSSRNLFRFSLIHLPAILILMIISRKTISPNDKPEITLDS